MGTMTYRNMQKAEYKSEQIRAIVISMIEYGAPLPEWMKKEMIKQGHDVGDLVAAEEHFQTLPLTWTPQRHAMYKLRAFRSVVECLFSLTIVNDDGIPLVS